MTIMYQSLRKFLMDNLRTINGGILAIACCLGLKKPRLPGMPKDVCWRFTAIFWNLCSESFCCFRIDQIILQFVLEVTGWYSLFDR